MTDASRTSSGLQCQLCDAIVTKNVASFTQEWLARSADIGDPAETTLIRQAGLTAVRISQDMEALKTQACETLQQASVTAIPVAGPEDTGVLQYHMIALSIAPTDIKPAVEALGTLGFIPPWPLTARRAAALAKYEKRLNLVRYDNETTRIALHFGGSQTSKIPTALRPRHADIAMADLPPFATWGYIVLRVARLARERFTGLRNAAANTDFLGTPAGLIDPIFDALHLTSDETLLDLGCGDGRIALAAAARGGHAIGVESNPELAQIAQQNIHAADLQARVHIQLGQAETADISKADVIFVFLPTHLIAKLLPDLLRRARTGTRIVTHEQTRLPATLSPSRSLPVFADNAMTVMHVWDC